MKKMFLTLGAWISSFFSKKRSESVYSTSLINETGKTEQELETNYSLNEQMDVEATISIAPSTKSENFWITKTDEELIAEPEISKDLLELQDQKVESIYTISKDRALIISSGERFELTEKQLVFYNIIRELQEKGQASSSNILKAYLNRRFNNLPTLEIENMTRKQNLSSHGKTLKGMFKSGLLERISRNDYRVKI
jgi:transglutaminase/protease-like cytokinesis protein 3